MLQMWSLFVTFGWLFSCFSLLFLLFFSLSRQLLTGVLGRVFNKFVCECMNFSCNFSLTLPSAALNDMNEAHSLVREGKEEDAVQGC